MERVVYLLGAGFSAPLGLPLMSNFRLRSEDMFVENPEKYAHFKEVFDTIRHMSIVKNYYETNLFNVEEILSILEMGEYLEGRSLKENFLQYISDVIEYYTPDLQPQVGAIPGKWDAWLFGTDRSLYPYAFFVSSILNLRFLLAGNRLRRGPYGEILCASNPKPRVRYSIVTLNYDLIPEKVCNFINGRFGLEHEVSFVTELDVEAGLYPTSAHGRFTASYAKLHGSVDTGVIVPPTWSKGVNREILPAWRLAYQLLADATQIRIVGYSLPTADAYVKFLLKSAVIQDPHLKKIDVICLDPDGSVKRRYDDFIKFDYYKFVNAHAQDYLNNHVGKYDRGPSKPDGFVLNKLEEAHEEFIASRG